MEAFTLTGGYVGTDRLGRPLYDAERDRFGTLLRTHDFTGASLVALRFAFKLTRSQERSRDLLGRTNLRLLRWGWDPAEVPLVKRLCRLVWSEFTNQKRETDAARRAEEVFLREQEATAGRPALVTPSVEARAIQLEEERAEDARDAKELEALRGKLAELRAHLQAEKDDVNLLWLGYAERDILDLARMARENGRDVTEFYAAAKRRKRLVQKLLSVKSDEAGDE